MDITTEPAPPSVYEVYRDRLVDLARTRDPQVIYLPDAERIEKERGDPSTSSNLAIRLLTDRGVFVRECLSEDGALLSAERVEGVLRRLGSQDPRDRDAAANEARTIQIRWRLVGGAS